MNWDHAHQLWLRIRTVRKMCIVLCLRFCNKENGVRDQNEKAGFLKVFFATNSKTDRQSLKKEHKTEYNKTKRFFIKRYLQTHVQNNHLAYNQLDKMAQYKQVTTSKLRNAINRLTYCLYSI